MAIEVEEEERKPSIAPAAPALRARAPFGSAEAWRERHDVGSDEDEPDTEEEDNYAQRSDGYSGNEVEDDAKVGDPGSSRWRTLFPRQQVDSAPLDTVKRDLDQLALEESIKSEERSQKLEQDPDAYTDSPMGMGAGFGEQKEFDPDRYLSPFVAYFDTQLNASLNGLPESLTSPNVRAQADKA